MPFANFKSIREVSSEDAVHCAENLLKIGEKKWRTKTVGEKMAYVVFELEEPYQITGIDIGNEHSAFVEVLVSKTSCNSNDFTEILVTCSFMTPMESRNSSNCNRVRCFSKDALVPIAISQKWKFVKVICTQPFNKHVTYGLSFIKLHVNEKKSGSEEESVSSKATEVAHESITSQKTNSQQNTVQLGNFKIREESPDSDPENRSLLFDRWKHCSTTPESTPATNVNISKKLQNESAENKPKKGAENNTRKVQQENKDVNSRIDSPNITEVAKKRKESNEQSDSHVAKHAKREIELKKDSQSDHKAKPNRVSDTERKETANVKVSISTESVLKTKKFRKFNQLLQGVVLVISGIQNPDRADLRTKALAMGAKYKPDWESCCTHLICAFQNTPKYNQVHGKGKIVKRNWIEDCYKMKKYLPWRRYALDSVDRDKPESDEEIFEESLQTPPVQNEERKVITNTVQTTDSDSDTEDEIERIVQSNKPDEEPVDVFDASTDEEDYLCQLKNNGMKAKR